ncbi:hypothetical protein AX14_010543 [Amanita brunnescens Koide BX004]|nr:hypothetical protein AX14_010543 [Amanita brunnescens Koide BX004]
MSNAVIAIPPGYQYVGAALLSTSWVLVYQFFLVARFRKRAGIQYPQLYAEKKEAEASPDAMKFNCAQRAHQNTLENLPIIAITSLVAGFKAPIFSASAVAFWAVGRIAYTRGYVTGDPKKRANLLNTLSTLGLLGLLLTATYTAGEWVFEGISKCGLV